MTAETREDAIVVYNNETVTGVVQLDGADGHTTVQNEITGAASGTVFILNGALNAGNFVLFTAANTTLVGGGTALPLQGATSGALVNFVAPGAVGSVTGDAGIVVAPLANSVVGGLTIENTGATNAYGIYTTGQSGVTAFGNTVTTLGAGANNHAIYFDAGADNARAIGNTIAAGGTFGHGIYFQNNNGGSAIGNTVTGSSRAIQFDVANNAAATGNSLTSTFDTIVLFSSNNITVSGNSIQATGNSASGVVASNSTGLTIAGNTFGPVIDGYVTYIYNNSTVVTAGSTGNIDNSTPFARCGGDGTATGTVSFTTAPNCVYP